MSGCCCDQLTIQRCINNVSFLSFLSQYYQEIVNMTYADSFGDRAQRLSDQEWMSVANARKLLKHMDRVKIALSSSRQAAIDYYSGLEKEAPFAHDVRFPAHQSWVAMDSGDWPTKVRQMLAALNFKELDQTRAGKERVEHATRAQLKPLNPGPVGNVGAADSQPVDEPRDSIPNDVLLSFVSAIQNMRLQIGVGEGVWTRRSFEDDLGLEWQ